MGKRQHQKDKMYLTTTEWATIYGGHKKSSHSGALANFRRLPLTHCALSLIEYVHPYCDNNGNIFDLEALLPFIKKYKVNPVTGEPLFKKNLIKLNIHKAATGEYHCPVLYKPLTNTTHVVAIKNTGNVFNHEAVEQLNNKANNWRDLLTDEPFTKCDIITLQDPTNLDKFNIASFHHIKNALRIEDEELSKSRTDSSLRLKCISKDTKMILDEFNETYKQPKVEESREKKIADKFNAAHYSTGKVSASFTSTTLDIETEHVPAVLADDVVRYRRVKKKGYVALLTNLGTLNFEIFCDSVPKASENFIGLCERKYYNGTILHRSIRHFMIQGGDPTGTGNGGESFWGKDFKNEIRQNLSHKGRGVLSMANSGPDTNKSQFFITFRSCSHLDGKHSIFGRLVGGLTTLSAVEAIETDNKDRPIDDIILVSTSVFVNPFAEADEQLAEERRQEELKRQKEEDELKSKKISRKDNSDKIFRSGIGKFLDLTKTSVSKEELQSTSAPKKKKKMASNDLNRFDSF